MKSFRGHVLSGVVFLLCVLFNLNSSLAGTLTAELGSDGIIRLNADFSGDFNCDKEGLTPSTHISEFMGCYSIRENGLSAQGERKLSCAKSGRIIRFDAGVAGGAMIDGVCTRRSENETTYITTNADKEVEIDQAMDRVTRGIEDVVVRYDFKYDNIDTCGDSPPIRTVSLTNAGVQSNMPASGETTFQYDFTNSPNYVKLTSRACCSGNCVLADQIFYIEPDDDTCDLGVGLPVYVGSGRVSATETDFSIPGIMPVTFTKTYSKNTQTSVFGPRWNHPYDIRAIAWGNAYKVINADGTIYYYMDNDGDKVYMPDLPRGLKSKVIENPDNTIVREYDDGRKEEFNRYGYLMALIDRNGNRINITRNTGNKMIKISEPLGREVNITYVSNRIDKIILPDGREIKYTYVSGKLQKVTYPDGSARTYEYSGYSLTGIKNELENYIEKHTYDSKGRGITSSRDGTNELLIINYVDDSHSTVTDSIGRATTYTIDKTKGKAHPTEISGPGCKTCGQGDTSYTYDEDLNITSITDASGNITVMTYDEMGNMLTRTEAYGTAQQRTTAYTYNEFGEVLTETDKDGILTNYTYDTSGNMLTKTEAYGTADERTTIYTYNAYGQLLITSDPGGNTTTNTYDQYGNLASVTNALNQTITYAYDIMGNLQSKTDANGRTTTYEYDPRDRLIRETKPDGGVINYEYDLAGNRTAVVDANGNRTTFNYDTINRLIKITDAEGNSINYTYDTEANMTSMTIRDSAGNIKTLETYTYDDRNRLTRTTHLDGTYTEQGYDAVGNVITKRDENGNVTRNTYDALKRLQSVTDPNGGITSYTYDVRNNLTFITDANGNITTYTYDSLNRLISTISPDTGTTTYTYDDNGNMLAKTDANGVITTYVYDALNRQISAQFPDPAQNIEYYYDDTQAQNGIGRSTSMTDQSGTTWYDRDTMGRVIKETKQIDSVIYRTEYSYDLNGNVLTMTYPGGRKITYTYNNLNKVTSVTDTYLGVPRTLASNITYQPFGDMASMTQGNGIMTGKTYDSRTQLNSLNIGMLKQLSYSRDDLGNITTITDALNPAMNKTFTYDALSRLTIAAGPWGAITYAYDTVGNRTLETTDTGTTTYNYTINTNKLESSAGEKAITFNYDNNGNATSENSRQYIYNQNQRLAQVTDAGAVLEEYVYNGKGQRARKCTDSGTRCTVYHYDQNGLLTAESTDTGTITNEYIYLSGNPLAKINSMVSGAAYNYPDPVGSPGFRASLSLNVNSSSLSTGYIKYVFKRMFLTNTSTTGLLVTGNTATVTGIGTVNNIILGVKETIPGCTITATITDGSPDAMGVEIRKPDGTIYYSAGTQSVASGNYTFGDNIYYYHNDHLGTPMIMTDSSGGIVWQGEFKPFGEPVSVSGSISNNLRFPGQYFDSKTGLHQNWFRDYKPEIGRYVEADPIGLKGGINLFTYVANSPCMWTDPLGLKTWMCEKPLDHLTERGWDSTGTKSGSDSWWNPLYHQYICVGNEDSPICGGQSSGGEPYGLGKPSNDKYNPDRCKEKDSDNDCLEKCIQKKIQNPKRPYYGLIGPGTNCQEWADDIYFQCARRCYWGGN